MSNFLDQLKRKQAAAKAAPPKQPGEMTEAELDAEIEQARAEVRRLREEAVATGREAVAANETRPRVIPRKRRRPWK